MVSDEQELDIEGGDGEDKPLDTFLGSQKNENLFKKVEKPKYGQGTPKIKESPPRSRLNKT